MIGGIFTSMVESGRLEASAVVGEKSNIMRREREFRLIIENKDSWVDKQCNKRIINKL